MGEVKLDSDDPRDTARRRRLTRARWTFGLLLIGLYAWAWALWGFVTVLLYLGIALAVAVFVTLGQYLLRWLWGYKSRRRS